ncbi:Regulator of G-protein signaling 3 [Chelonia mydas]|uniref:Regulator of G-protein signaling 3 n=1 Tax=Chelonia mydas TaxID=8469 RepID=M7B0P6_CHEMY|nr:Regulator of G-protein signaling 3 [Chelonia mydas]
MSTVLWEDALLISFQPCFIFFPVMEAKGLMGKEYRTCDSYVKSHYWQRTWELEGKALPVAVSAHHFLQVNAILQTKERDDNGCPVQEEDEQKRLLVTVWNQERNSRQSQLIGCMSFGVKSLLTPDKITIPRGRDGFGFTICCDSPVRVQAVDSGGPAEKAGLQQLDTVVQLNQQPVEHWKCVELAHEIRNCPSEIILLVWRIVPQIKPGLEGMIRRSSCKSTYDLQSPPNKREKNSTVPSRPEHRQSCHIVYNSSDRLVLNNCPRYTEVGKRSQHTMPPLSRASSDGDKNYILLAPLNPGSQLLRPVYQEHNAAVGNAGKGKSHTGSGRKSRLMKTVQTMKSYGNYQNCTIVRPHIPHSSYGTYVTLAPKVLVFPVFVQELVLTLEPIASPTPKACSWTMTLEKAFLPLDLCNPVRTLLLSEELLLHEGRSRTVKVTVFIYSDLLLFTKEDEPGRCNVLRNPLYLQSVKLQEGSSEDLKFCILYLAESSAVGEQLSEHPTLKAGPPQATAQNVPVGIAPLDSPSLTGAAPPFLFLLFASEWSIQHKVLLPEACKSSIRR